MPVHLLWQTGGEATVLQTDGATVLLRSSRSAPPGSPLEARLQIDEGLPARVKVHDCRREPDGSFVLRGRWVDMSRDTRVRLQGAMAAQA